MVTEMRNLQVQLNESTEAVEAAQRLSDQLDRKEELISALREEGRLGLGRGIVGGVMFLARIFNFQIEIRSVCMSI